MTRLFRLWLAHRAYLNACRNLAKMKAKSAQSSQDYAKRRKAGKLGWQRRKAAA